MLEGEERLVEEGFQVEGLMSSLVQLAASFAVAALFLVATGGFPFVVDAASWPWVLVLGAVNTGIGCYLYFSSFGGLRAQTVAILGYLEPVSAVVCALVFLHEPMGQRVEPKNRDEREIYGYRYVLDLIHESYDDILPFYRTYFWLNCHF